jgi:hypothetical protein
VFQKWQRNGADFSTNRVASLTVDADATFTAVYVAPPRTTFTLSFASTNPTTGVSVGVSPNDVGGLGAGTTPFARTFSNQMVVTLTAPATAATNVFQKWQRNGTDFSTNRVASLTVDADATFTAVYLNTAASGALVRLRFNERSGLATVNEGSGGGAFALTAPVPTWTTNVPAGVGAASALDFGVSSAGYAVDSAAPLPALAGLARFTLTGWLNNRSTVQGSGGNRILSCVESSGAGFELVYRGDGSLDLGVNQPPSGVARSSANRIPAEFEASAANWRFFAVTYDATARQAQFYFGSNAGDAAFDRTVPYTDGGVVGATPGRLTVGHMPPALRSSFPNRIFRGIIDDIQLYDRVLTAAEIVAAQRGTGGGGGGGGAPAPAALPIDESTARNGPKVVALRLERETDGNVRLHLAGVPGHPYRVLISRDLVTWEEWLHGVIGEGRTELWDHTAPKAPARFYLVE